MKTLKNIMLGMVIITAVLITGVCGFYNYQIAPVSKSDEIIEVEISFKEGDIGIFEIKSLN